MLLLKSECTCISKIMVINNHSDSNSTVRNSELSELAIKMLYLICKKKSLILCIFLVYKGRGNTNDR